MIHCRYLAAAIKDWPALVRQAYENTAPGGFVELQDFDLEYYSEDGSLKEDMAIRTWQKAGLEASRSFQRDPCPGPKLERWVKDAGFENVTVQRYKIPIGPWAKDPHLASFPSRTGVMCGSNVHELMAVRKPSVHGILSKLTMASRGLP